VADATRAQTQIQPEGHRRPQLKERRPAHEIADGARQRVAQSGGHRQHDAGARDTRRDARQHRDADHRDPGRLESSTGDDTPGPRVARNEARGEPITFPLSGVIKCWGEGVQQMKVGGKSRLVCPADTAYGDRGAPPKIKPGATLVFEVELLEIVK